MKIKLFIVTLVLTAVLYFAANYFFVDYAGNNLMESTKSTVSQSVSIYHHITEADKFEAIRKVDSIAKNAKLIEALDQNQWAEVSEEILSAFAQEVAEEGKEPKRVELSPKSKAFVDKIEAEMNVISQLYDDSDTMFVTDDQGNIIAKDLDGIFRGINIAEEKLFQVAMRGTSNRDVMNIKGKTYIVSAAPILNKDTVIGVYCSADYVDSETAKNAAANLGTPSSFYFGFFDETTLLGSTLPTSLHESFKKFIKENQELIKKVDEEGSKIHDTKIVLNGENFFASISRYPSLSENNDMFYITLVSKDKLLEPLASKRITFGLIVCFALLVALVLLYIADEQNGKPVNKFMEGMLEIINGNIRFRFNNSAEGVEGNLNQNANLMIATILGERMPDKDKISTNNK